MNEIGKRAREAAIDHGMWLAPDDDETNYQAFVAGYLRGYSDRGVEATAARDEYEKELATLRARVAELEGMVPRWVPVARKIALDIQGWLPIDDQKCGDSERQWLMVPPIPLPEKNEGER